MTDIFIVKRYIRMANDGWLQGWHERNGGNLTYRLTKEEVAEMRPFFDAQPREWVPMGVTGENLAGEYFLSTGSGKFFRNVELDPEDFESTYTRLIERTLPTVKGMILMTPYFMEPNKQDPMRARMDEYGAIVRKLAEKYNLTFIDLQAAWDELFKHMHPCNIAWDRIHPNQTGCMYIAKQFLKAVGADRC